VGVFLEHSVDLW